MLRCARRSRTVCRVGVARRIDHTDGAFGRTGGPLRAQWRPAPTRRALLRRTLLRGRERRPWRESSGIGCLRCVLDIPERDVSVKRERHEPVLQAVRRGDVLDTRRLRQETHDLAGCTLGPLRQLVSPGCECVYGRSSHCCSGRRGAVGMAGQATLTPVGGCRRATAAAGDW